MMLLRKKPGQDERLELVRRQVLLAIKVSDDEIEAVACSNDLYDGLQLRIAAKEGRQIAERTHLNRGVLNLFQATLGRRRTPRWILTAAAVLVATAIALSLWLPRQPLGVTPIEPDSSASLASSPTPEAQLSDQPKAQGELAVVRPARQRPRRAVHRRRQIDTGTDEIATDFLPLTYTADSTAQVSGHLVRVTVPRSALVGMGLPMNAERAGERVRADVFIGDDGLARAIRFIQ
jgi:hypothetical protein